MNVRDILDGIQRLRALVIGDICLDRWCYYDPSAAEPSAETGIPRIGVVRTELTPGAGGTIANNLVALGVSQVSVMGLIGEDGFGWELLRALKARAIATDLLISSPGAGTFTYTKLINAVTGKEDRPRVDYINIEPFNAGIESELIARIESSFPHFDVVLVSDQAETQAGGVISPGVRDSIIRMAGSHTRKIVWVDSRMRAELFRYVVVKPNRREAEAACARLFGGLDLPRLRSHCNLRALIVTHGDLGVRVFTQGGEYWVPGRKVEAVDICGAGDSFSAGAACALSVTGSEIEAARFGNLVASITVTKKGTGTASPEEVLSAAQDYSG